MFPNDQRTRPKLDLPSEWDPVQTGPLPAMLFFSLLLGAVMSLWLIRRWQGGEPWPQELLDRFSWLAFLPFEREFVAQTSPTLVAFGATANALATLSFLLTVAIAVAPKPKSERWMTGREWRFLKNGSILCLIALAFREFSFFEVARLATGERPMQPKDFWFFINLICMGQCLAMFGVMWFYFLKLALRKQATGEGASGPK